MTFGPPAMGYDRAITVFSPDGKLYQVEYAAENIKKGWTTVAVKIRDAALIAAEKRRIAPLIDMKDIVKIYIIDTHIGSSFAGLAADGRILIDYARKVAMNYRFIYDEPADVEYVVRNVCDIKQIYTQHAGVRPFGVSLVFAGYDRKGPQLFKTEINGYYFSYKALALGSGDQAATEYLEKHYRDGMDREEAVKLALSALRASTGSPLSPGLVELGIITEDDKTFRKLTVEEIAKYVKAAGVDK